MSLQNILKEYASESYSARDKGSRFEELMKRYLETEPKYNTKKIYLWNEFPYKDQFGRNDVGIDLVIITEDDEYWAVQCKCYDEKSYIQKQDVDTFLSTSSKKFKIETGKEIKFSQRLWIATTNHFSENAETAFHNQDPEVIRIRLSDLENSSVDWDKLDKGLFGTQARIEKKNIFEHQKTALENTHAYFKTKERGKLIMACGTGKTFTSLKIAENETGGDGGVVLFLVPSIALLGQTLNEWTNQSDYKINAICICSDSEVSKKKIKDSDNGYMSVIDLAMPATTNIDTIIHRFENVVKKDDALTVVFSTYQSIKVISEAQKKLIKKMGSKAEFDLIICDEAHRTTGVTFENEDESEFVKVHNNDYIKAKKRLYMTATPRLYSDESKTKANENNAVLCSMDDEKLYGQEIYRIGFGEAVEKDLLSDYKVLVLTLSERNIHPTIQRMLKSSEGEIAASDDTAKLIGCINALSKRILGDNGILKDEDPNPMRRAVAFCQSIKVSKATTELFNNSYGTYYPTLSEDIKKNLIEVESKHIDGTMSATERDEKLSWLKADTGNIRECRMLTNVKCLSEGVDVPSLDAVLFLSAKNSQIDVVQSVGRVMRKAKGKKYGYIIIPILIPSDMAPEEALNDNKRYKVVWTVLNALRAHDDRFNAIVNKIELNKERDPRIIVGGVADDSDEDSGAEKKEKSGSKDKQFVLPFIEYQDAIYAKIVQKVGDRNYWEDWARDIAKIAETYTDRINELIKKSEHHKKEFESFINELRQNINPNITADSAIEMLSQHLITQPVFEALFENYSFVKNNAVSKSMQKMTDVLEREAFEKDREVLKKFYESVKERAKVDNAEAKQKLIIKLYDSFFKIAFPKMVEKLGIAYTPVECVDFIIHSVEYLLKKEFESSITNENVHILDPFTGTGTFIVRLLQSGLIDKNDIERKYKKELHANEIVLLAYYIASVNIENIYHDITCSSGYESFEGICLTDTFQINENDDTKEETTKFETVKNEMFEENSERVKKQKNMPIKVIMSNPPYSKGQKSENDNAKNERYPNLEKKIAATYVANSKSTSNSTSYDSYIKAFRWSTDRLEKRDGIVAFISNGSWIDGNASDGFRKCIENEFSSIYVFNLRGNAQLSGEIRKKESGNIFGENSKNQIAVTFLIKKENHKGKAKIYYHDIGDYLKRDEKLKIISDFKNIGNLKLKNIKPNEHGDWLSKRSGDFEDYISLSPDKKFNTLSKSFFTVQTIGLKSNRDTYVYNYSNKHLQKTMKEMITSYNKQVELYEKDKDKNIEKHVEMSSREIKWTRSLKNSLSNLKKNKYSESNIRISIYRPFSKQNLYADRFWIQDPGLYNVLFPISGTENLVINFSGLGSNKNFSCYISNTIIDQGCLDACTQCFPLYWYEKNDDEDMFEKDGYKKHSAISSYILEEAKKLYGKKITDEDIFYYVYGVLHSREYREKYAPDLKRSLPHLPLIKDYALFSAFSKAGRELAILHLNYESHRPNKSVAIEERAQNYKVEKMRFPSKNKNGETDKSTIYYNSYITIKNIPASAYKYIVNGKSSIEWIMERYQKTVDKDSGITNDPNLWAEENEKPRYILDLLLSVIAMSVKSVEIIEGLPSLGFDR